MQACSCGSARQSDYLSELARRGLESLKKLLIPIPGYPDPSEQEPPYDLLEFKDHLNNSDDLARFIEDQPHLQLLLARLVDYTPNRWLLAEEIPEIRCRRGLQNIPTTDFDPEKPDPKQPELSDPYLWAQKNALQGICLSGGGIRSATLNLGILQGLAKLKLLGRFDYLSSVSGGGYIHEWLAAWIKREEERDQGAGFTNVQRQLTPLPAGAQLPLEPEPIRWLRRYSNYLTPQKGLLTTDTWAAVAVWLRNTFLNQLVLLSGLFFLVLVVQLLGGILKNTSALWGTWIPVVLFVIATVAIGRALGREYERIRFQDEHPGEPPELTPRKFSGQRTVQVFVFLLTGACALHLRTLLSGSGYPWCAPIIVFLALFLLALVVALCGRAVTSFWILHHGQRPGERGKAPESRGQKSKRIVAMILVSLPLVFGTALLGAAGGTAAFLGARWLLLKYPPAIAQSLYPAGATGPFTPSEDVYDFLYLHQWQPAKSAGTSTTACAAPCKWAPRAVRSVYCGLTKRLRTVGAGTSGILQPSRTWQLQVVFGPPLLMTIPFLVMVLCAGLVGRDFADWLREWLARVRAWGLLIGVGWAFVFGVAVFGPSLVDWAPTQYGKLVPTIKWSAVVAWIVTTAGSVLAGKSAKTGGGPSASSSNTSAKTGGGSSASSSNAGAKNGGGSSASSSNSQLELLARVGPYVFVVGLLVALSKLASVGLAATSWWLLALGSLFLFLLFGWRVDVNEFSMNPFYRNRLTRCYLGGTNRMRDPNPLTGFDDRDTRGMQISRLRPRGSPDSIEYTGPSPIISAAIDLSFGEDLAWQERKAASFAFTPRYCGYYVGWTAGKGGERLSLNGFVPTREYAFPDGGINLATAVAISGAAVSPNWGFHTNPATAFLMTVFNVRLGWWILNPRRAKLAGRQCSSDGRTEWASPRFTPTELVKELLGMADDSAKYVYLSDGGHFDNMGLYELVRRRCYNIVICDAEEDPNYSFEGIGMAIRKCRIDFGAEITLDLSPLRSDPATGYCAAHAVRGTIRYPETPPNSLDNSYDGTVLYIKASLTGPVKFNNVAFPEPADVLSYKRQDNAFPHDSTANQWFTESQFEAYRRLGTHIAEEIEKQEMWSRFGPKARFSAVETG